MTNSLSTLPAVCSTNNENVESGDCLLSSSTPLLSKNTKISSLVVLRLKRDENFNSRTMYELNDPQKDHHLFSTDFVDYRNSSIGRQPSSFTTTTTQRSLSSLLQEKKLIILFESEMLRKTKYMSKRMVMEMYAQKIVEVVTQKYSICGSSSSSPTHNEVYSGVEVILMGRETLSRKLKPKRIPITDAEYMFGRHLPPEWKFRTAIYQPDVMKSVLRSRICYSPDSICIFSSPVRSAWYKQHVFN